MGRSSLLRYAVLSAGVAIICGFLHALPLFAALPTAGTLFSAARGLASLDGLAGYQTASSLDWLNGWLWRMGGSSLLGWGQWLWGFLGWTVAAFLALAIVRMLAGFGRNPRRGRMLCILAAVLLLASGLPAAWQRVSGRGGNISNLNFVAPVELIAKTGQLAHGELFANASGQAHLLLFAPALAGATPPDQAAQLAGNPILWRERLRQEKWRAVLLTGPLTEFRPLLDHLITSPDWRIATITNQGYLFLRGSGPAALSLEIDSFKLADDGETALHLAQIAERYDAVRRTTDARSCIDRALQLAPRSASVLAYAATFAAAHKRWQDAISLSNKALAVEPDFAQAKIIQALALLEINETGRAQDLVAQVLARNPDDLSTLFLYARISRALNDYAQEAATLEKLITLSTAAGLPVINYQIYLGQAYARLGQAKPALKNYRAVLADGQLNKEQAAEIEEAIATIEAREKP